MCSICYFCLVLSKDALSWLQKQNPFSWHIILFCHWQQFSLPSRLMESKKRMCIPAIISFDWFKNRKFWKIFTKYHYSYISTHSLSVRSTSLKSFHMYTSCKSKLNLLSLKYMGICVLAESYTMYEWEVFYSLRFVRVGSL